MVVWLFTPLEPSAPIERPPASRAAFAGLLFAGLATGGQQAQGAEEGFKRPVPAADGVGRLAPTPVEGRAQAWGAIGLKKEPRASASPQPSADASTVSWLLQLLPSVSNGDAEPFQQAFEAGPPIPIATAEETIEGASHPPEGEVAEGRAQAIAPSLFVAVSEETDTASAGDAGGLEDRAEPETKPEKEGAAGSLAGAAAIDPRAQKRGAPAAEAPAASVEEPEGLWAAPPSEGEKRAPERGTVPRERAGEPGAPKAEPPGAEKSFRAHPARIEGSFGDLSSGGSLPEEGAGEGAARPNGLEAERPLVRSEKMKDAIADPPREEPSASFSLRRADGVDGAARSPEAKSERPQGAPEKPGTLEKRASPSTEPGEGKVRAEQRGGFSPAEAALSFSSAPHLAGARTPAPAWSPVVASVAHALRAAVGAGREEVVIQLEPPELGKLRIEIAVEKNRVEARLIPDSPEAAGLLESRLGELRLSLRSQNLETLGITVELAGGGGAETGGGPEPRERPGGRGRLAEARGSRASAQRASGSRVSVWA